MHREAARRAGRWKSRGAARHRDSHGRPLPAPAFNLRGETAAAHPHHLREQDVRVRRGA